MADQISINNFLDNIMSNVSIQSTNPSSNSTLMLQDQIQAYVDKLLQTQQGMDIQAALEPILKVLGIEQTHHEDMFEHVRRRLAVVFDAQAAHDKCRAEATATGGDEVTQNATYIVCTETEYVRQFPDSKTDQDEARTQFRAWEAAQPADSGTVVVPSSNEVNDLAGFEPSELHTQCKAQASVQGGSYGERTWSDNYIVCKDRELDRLFPNSAEDRTRALIAFRTWSEDSAKNSEGHVTLADGSDTNFQALGVATGVTTAGRVAYIFLFVGMWGCMAFPIIYDIIVVTSHYVVTFTPHANNQDAILADTVHKKFYVKNVYDASRRNDTLDYGDWNAWTVWNTGQLLISFATFVFYIYIAIAIIVALVEDESGTYENSTALLN